MILKPPKIYLARHGKTEANRNGIILGTSDSILLSESIGHLRTIASMLQDERIMEIHSSPLGRAAKSAEIIASSLKIEVSLHPELKEISTGKWEGMKRAEILPGRNVLREQWDFVPPGGESYQEAKNRLSPYIQLLITKTQITAILIVAHCAINRVLLKLLFNLECDDAMRIRHPHDMIYIFEPPGEISRLDLSGNKKEGFLMFT